MNPHQNQLPKANRGRKIFERVFLFHSWTGIRNIRLKFTSSYSSPLNTSNSDGLDTLMVGKATVYVIIISVL